MKKFVYTNPTFTRLIKQQMGLLCIVICMSLHVIFLGPSWSYGSWIYNYLCYMPITTNV